MTTERGSKLRGSTSSVQRSAQRTNQSDTNASASVESALECSAPQEKNDQATPYTSVESPVRVLLLGGGVSAGSPAKRLGSLPTFKHELSCESQLTKAIARLRETPIDVVLLDMSAPDQHGVRVVKKLREVSPSTPIIVLTDDEVMALACIEAGAQDYLSDEDLRRRQLSRSIICAISRLDEDSGRQPEGTVERYKSLSSAEQQTSVTAALSGSGAIALRNPAVFSQLIEQYSRLLVPGAFDRRHPESRAVMEQIVTTLGDRSGGPRDLLDVHIEALDRMSQVSMQSKMIIFEARLIALEMMGLLVDYYRVGQRRRSSEGIRP